jgi:AcrR family transcriptional regulator
MTSLRHSPAPRWSAGPDDAYLDAARDAILAVGWGRTTLTDIARRAGVSRMTLYRRWSDTRALLADLLTRELSGLLAETVAEIEGGSRAALVDAVCAMVKALRTDPLLARIIELDPELLLPYLLERRGRSQDLVAGVLAERVATAQRAGQVRPGSPTAIARSILLTAQGFILSAHTMGRVGDYDRELRLLLDGYLRP